MCCQDVTGGTRGDCVSSLIRDRVTDEQVSPCLRFTGGAERVTLKAVPWPPDFFHVGDAVRTLRERRGWVNLSGLIREAQEAGHKITRQRWRRFEASPEKSRKDTVDTIAAILGIPAADLRVRFRVLAEAADETRLRTGVSDETRDRAPERAPVRNSAQRSLPEPATAEAASGTSAGEQGGLPSPQLGGEDMPDERALLIVVRRLLGGNQALENQWYRKAIRLAEDMADADTEGPQAAGGEHGPP